VTCAAKRHRQRSTDPACTDDTHIETRRMDGTGSWRRSIAGRAVGSHLAHLIACMLILTSWQPPAARCLSEHLR
jgi:hypothetical protein